MTKFIIVSIAVAFLLGQVARLQFNNIGVTLLDVLVGVVVLGWWGRQIVHHSLPSLVSRPTKLFTGFIGLGIIGILLFSPNLTFLQGTTAFLYAVRFGIYGSLFIIASRLSNIEKDFSLKVALATGMGMIFLGYLQYLFYPYLRNLYYLGWDDHLYRMFGTFLDPNFAGAFFSLLLFFLYDLFFTAKSRQKKVLYSFLAGITLIALILTYSRTGFIMLLVGSGIYLLLFASRKVAIGSLISFIFVFLLMANTKIEGLNPLRTASSLARVESAQHALQIIQTYPVVGVGFNAYRYAQVEMGFREEFPKFQSHADSGTDNSYLFVLATTGIIGGVVFILYWKSILRHIWENAKSNHFPARSLFAGLVAVLVGSMFLNVMFYPMIIGWLLIQGGLIRRS